VSAFSHTPVLLAEVLSALRPAAGGRYFDGTLGGAGHSAAILGASSPNGFLYACDRDGEALAAAAERLSGHAGRHELRRARFSEAASWVPEGVLDGALLDLGVSSHQIDTARRGFSFQLEGNLDMRMDTRGGATAAELVNTLSASELSTIFREYGDERDAWRIARAVEEARREAPIATTTRLAALVERIRPRHGSPTHPATRVFQALRIAVNAELDEVSAGLRVLFPLLRPGGRLAVISFHSAEDRIVKDFMRSESRDYDVAGPVDHPDFRTPRTPRGLELHRKGLVAGPEELAANPRSRSARLRVLERL
jgi:16S rRNA (cytosine1402-N4)-methyltransferase